MSNFLTWLNANSGAFNLLFTAVVALATVFYAVLTRALVAETRRLREAQTEPQVTVRVESSPVWINLVELIVENIGSGPALDLKLTATPDFAGLKDRPLSQFGPFKHGVKVFGPHQRITTPLGNLVGKGAEIEDPGGPLQFAVQAKYRSALGRVYEQTYAIDFRQLIGSRRIGTPPLQAIAQSLEEIKTDLSHLASGWSKLKIIRYTPEDLNRENDEDFAEVRDRLASEPNDPDDPAA